MTGSFTVRGYVAIDENLNGSYSTTVSASGFSPGAINAGTVTWFGSVEISSKGETLLQSTLSEPAGAYLTGPDSTLIGTTTFALPLSNIDISFKIELNVGYLLTTPEGTYPSPVMTRELPIFKEQNQ